MIKHDSDDRLPVQMTSLLNQDLHIFAFDHRSQMEAMADLADVGHDRIGEFKQLCLEAVQLAESDIGTVGILCDSKHGAEALGVATDSDYWIGRPVELPGSRPLEFEPELGPQLDGLASWPKNHIVKVLCFYHPEDEVALKQQQESALVALAKMAKAQNLELLVEIIPSKCGPVSQSTTAEVIQRLYDIGIFPDWWKLEPLEDFESWRVTCDVVHQNDVGVKGIVVLGLDAPVDQLQQSFEIATQFDLVKGFAVGRTLFSKEASLWLSNTISSQEAVMRMKDNFVSLSEIWDKCRQAAG